MIYLQWVWSVGIVVWGLRRRGNRGQIEKYVEAKAFLDRNKLTSWLAVVRVFPGGPGRRVWITEQHHAILAGAAVSRKTPQVAKAPVKSPIKPSTKAPEKSPPQSVS